MLSCVLENKIGFHTKKFAVEESNPQERGLMPSLFWGNHLINQTKAKIKLRKEKIQEEKKLLA